jgi:rod shape-determining protein MreC
VKEGDLILTSGDGGLFPRGLPVGVAVKDLRGGWRVRLYADDTNIDYIRILVFEDFSQIADMSALADAPLPPVSPEERAEIEAALSGRPIAASPAEGEAGAQPAGAQTSGAQPAPRTASPAQPATRPATPRTPAAPRTPAPRPSQAQPPPPRTPAPAPATPSPVGQPPPALDGLL